MPRFPRLGDMHFGSPRVQRRLSVTFLGSSPVLSLRAPFGPVRTRIVFGAFGVLPRLKTDDCPLELPVVRQVFAQGEKAGGRHPLCGPPEDEGADDVRREIG